MTLDPGAPATVDATVAPERAGSRHGSDWLAESVAAGIVDTVRVSFADRLGRWRGKRVPAQEFLDRAPYSMGFCDGMIVCDVQCGVIEQTPFSNYATGYPDMHVRFDASDARPVGWSPGEAFVFGRPTAASGEPLKVAPVNVLASVERRLAAAGVAVTVTATLAGALVPATVRDGIRSQPEGRREQLCATLLAGLHATGLPTRHACVDPGTGAFEVCVGPGRAASIAEMLVVVKGAAKEVARTAGYQAVFMTCRPGSTHAAYARLEIQLCGSKFVSETELRSTLSEARPFFYPSINAMKAPPRAPTSRPLDAGMWSFDAWASSEADPATALAVALAAVGAAEVDVAAKDDAKRFEVEDLRDAARLHGVAWLPEWLGAEFVDNSVPLFEHEAALFQASITDWEVARYWNAS